MSFDPFGQQEQPGQPNPSPGSVQPQPTPPQPELTTSSEQVRQKVMLPAIFLIVVAVIDLLFAGYESINLLMLVSLPAEEFTKIAKANPFFEQLKKQQPGQAEPDWANFQKIALVIASVLTGLNFLSALVIIIGSVRMLQMRSWGFALFAAIVAGLPIVSCAGCCGIGEAVALWAIIVLMQPDVRQAFK